MNELNIQVLVTEVAGGEVHTGPILGSMESLL